jgi:hypothetical protein
MSTYLKEMPYCETASYPDFHTKVTSHALVAWSLQDRKAETAFPPTMMYVSIGGAIKAEPQGGQDALKLGEKEVSLPCGWGRRCLTDLRVYEGAVDLDPWCASMWPKKSKNGSLEAIQRISSPRSRSCGTVFLYLACSDLQDCNPNIWKIAPDPETRRLRAEFPRIANAG